MIDPLQLGKELLFLLEKGKARFCNGRERAFLERTPMKSDRSAPLRSKLDVRVARFMVLSNDR
jgi:hypothetical protein